MLELKIENGRIGGIYDRRYPDPVDITDGSGTFGQPVYTSKAQDITKEEKTPFVPYNSRTVPFAETTNGRLQNRAFGASLKAEEKDGGIALDLTVENDSVSACGISLPFSFLGKKNNPWQRQFAASSPYRTADGSHFLFYLTRPDGNHLCCIVENAIDGYRICYSDFLCGHYIMGLEFLSQFDRAYGKPKRAEKRVKLRILAVSSFREALEKAAALWAIPALYYDTAATYIGQPFRFTPIGKWDKIVVTAPSGKTAVLDAPSFTPREYGIHTAVPFDGEKAGADCCFFAHDALCAMFRRACLAVKQDRSDVIGKTAEGRNVFKPQHATYRGYEDFNLCEHAMWSLAALRYMRDNGAGEPLSGDVKNLLSIITGSCDCPINCCTIDENALTRHSTRIQEVYNGVSILMDAFRVFGDENYLEFAVSVLRKRLRTDLSPAGAILRRGSDGTTAEIADYTTVTCMVIPVVDMALLLQDRGDKRARYFAQCAERIADFVVRRDLDFPTEGGVYEQVNPEVEEGSMSCAALTVLYTAQFIRPKKAYLDYAERVLKLHDAFTAFTPHPVMFRSTLRWWETIWEGDADGPAMCYGHAWSIWRAEAEYRLALLTHDDKRLLDAYNCFMTNLAKEDTDGNMYAIYQYEPISSGALAESGAAVDFSDRVGFPRKKDTTLSRYVFARGYDTWLKTVAVLPDRILGGCLCGDEIVPFEEGFTTLYIGDVTGSFTLRASARTRIISAKRVRITGSAVLRITVY